MADWRRVGLHARAFYRDDDQLLDLGREGGFGARVEGCLAPVVAGARLPAFGQSATSVPSAPASSTTAAQPSSKPSAAASAGSPKPAASGNPAASPAASAKPSVAVKPGTVKLAWVSLA